ncbi:hypothetical protein FH972_002710 [Carpinus fangiana]|uniref:Uncharacterized protein n=1 Tax=Carpinus fangiana TaxID=176857 RepID=A0A5N6QG75_9ROSI|nr:hypothetical protein FH972_002710 [Carpinus fangiana]
MGLVFNSRPISLDRRNYPCLIIWAFQNSRQNKLNEKGLNDHAICILCHLHNHTHAPLSCSQISSNQLWKLLRRPLYFHLNTPFLGFASLISLSHSHGDLAATCSGPRGGLVPRIARPLSASLPRPPLKESSNASRLQHLQFHHHQEPYSSLPSRLSRARHHLYGLTRSLRSLHSLRLFPSASALPFLLRACWPQQHQHYGVFCGRPLDLHRFSLTRYSYSSNVRFHVVPNRSLMFSDFEKLPVDCGDDYTNARARLVTGGHHRWRRPACRADKDKLQKEDADRMASDRTVNGVYDALEGKGCCAEVLMINSNRRWRSRITMAYSQF